MLFIATLPLAIGALIDKYVEAMFDSTLFVGCALIFTAAVLFLAERHGGGDKTASNGRFSDAAIVGLAQLLSLIHI